MSKQSTILIVDDESTVREVLRKYLESEGFRVLEAINGPQTLGLVREELIDLIILDVMLPGGFDGFSIARLIRSSDEYAPLSINNIPIILLTARGTELDRVTGFEVGADDYVVKPFSPREVVFRVKAILRRSAPVIPEDNAPIQFTDFEIDPRSRNILVRGTPVILTAKEFDLLWFLARHPRQVFNRQQLLDNVWGYEFYGDESTVTVHIRRLREKIEIDAANPVYLLTVWGVGYKFEV